MLFNFLYWSFGFLRMSTTGFVAQAAGRCEALELRRIFSRGVVVALVLASILLLAQSLFQRWGLALLGADGQVHDYASQYFSHRIWGAPATLLGYVLTGVLVGLGATRQVLWVQLLLNGSNALLDVAFVRLLDWGPGGLGAGTAIASWLSLGLAFHFVVRLLRDPEEKSSLFQKSILRDLNGLKEVMSANLNLMVRTLLLLSAFALVTWRGGQLGEQVLSANHLLLQYISFSAFFLDGFAFVAEAQVGNAFGRKDRQAFIDSMRNSTELAIGTGLILALVLFLSGTHALRLLTSLPLVLREAQQSLPYAVSYIALSAVAFQLDGVFIGITGTRALRNASLVSFGLFVISFCLFFSLESQGLWLALCIYLVARAVCLAAQLPAVLRKLPSNRVN